MDSNTRAPDLLRRFTHTPHMADFSVMGRIIRLETNSEVVLEQTTRYLAESSSLTPGLPDFAWKIVSEGDSASAAAWPELTAFSHDRLAYADIGDHGFVAVDSTGREAVGFLPEALVKNTLGFGRSFLAMLFSLTSGALGLTAILAACVGRGKASILVFGAPDSGKTMASCLAGHFGLELHAGEVAFVEPYMAGLRAWGEFWPTLFREDEAKLLPELLGIAKRVEYQERTYFCLEKMGRPAAKPSSAPAACLFLQRHDGQAYRLNPIGCDEVRRRLRECSRLSNGDHLERSQSPVWNLLETLPGFHLAYGGDPSVSTGLIRDLFEGLERLEIEL